VESGSDYRNLSQAISAARPCTVLRITMVPVGCFSRASTYTGAAQPCLSVYTIWDRQDDHLGVRDMTGTGCPKYDRPIKTIPERLHYLTSESGYTSIHQRLSRDPPCRSSLRHITTRRKP